MAEGAVQLVERNEILADLRQALAQVPRRGGRMVVFTNSAGIGKISMVRALATEAAPGLHRLMGCCDALTTLQPLVPLLEMARDVPRLRQAAADAGHGAFPKGVPLHECIVALDGHGAMGLHRVNEILLDTTLNPSRPEVLVFEPTENGELRLVALEYVVFAEAWA